MGERELRARGNTTCWGQLSQGDTHLPEYESYTQWHWVFISYYVMAMRLTMIATPGYDNLSGTKRQVLRLNKEKGPRCSDELEMGSDETIGGLRDAKNHWDFYDVRGQMDLPSLSNS